MFWRKCKRCGARIRRKKNFCEDCLSIMLQENREECRRYYDGIDTSGFSDQEKLGLAYCKIVCGDEAVVSIEGQDIVLSGRDAMNNIKALIGEAEASWAWWRFELRRSREDWLRWWLTERTS